jgi:hypothetical protein
MAFRLALVTARHEPPVAREAAATFGAIAKEVVRLGAPDWRVLVAWAAQVKLVPNRGAFFQLLENVRPHWDIVAGICIPDEIETMLCSTEKYVDPVLGPKETRFALRIAPDKGYNDNLGLLALEIVNGGESQSFEKLLLL